uniref:Bile salt export pump n=1 Tax=Chaetoceros debilis TaxID=122233 RepID=A0A7S3QFU2_9STRA|mmetsp:Transcript_3473/g.4920  ORF Transcript_3473/g.4920 Transcript_3473/m.4920 type:complete len:664 (-) Transcript_3473:170-2161(-)
MSSSSKDNGGSPDIENPGAEDKASDNAASEKKTNVAPPSLRRLFQTVKAEQPMLFVGLVLLFAAESTGQVIPLIVAKAYDAIIDFTLDNDEKMADINYYMLISILIFIAGIFAGFLRGSIFGVVAERMVARLRNDLYGSILKQDIAFFDENKSGELVSRLGSDTTLLQGVVGMSLPEALINIVKAIVSIVLIFIISPELAGVSIGTIFVIVIISLPLGKMLAKYSKEYQDALGEAQTFSTEAIGSMRTVQSFAAESKEKNRYSGHIGDPDMYPWWWPKNKVDVDGFVKKSTYSIGFRRSIVNSGFFSIIFGGGFGFLYVCLWYGFYLVQRGDMTLGELTAFQSYVFNIGLGLGTASTHIAKIIEGLGASGRVFYLLDAIPSIPSPPKEGEKGKVLLKPKSMEGRINFEKVKFAYPSRPDIDVLDDYTLEIPPDSTTALVGSSGSGKSTVVALLQRFYDINGGTLTIDDVDIKDLDVKWLRQHIGYVQQEPQLFGVSVRENLLYGVPDNEIVSQETIEQACRDANCHDFISSWPEGYGTLVGERGVKLSGGQKQRISIARALITNCRILLLDEATSALDAESEHLVQEAIDKAVVGRTVIIVAHRLSTIQRANQIVVMSNHKIVDVGTHEYLLQNCVKYEDLIKRQNMVASSSSSNALKELDMK